MSEERFEELEAQVREARQLADESRALTDENKKLLISQEHRFIPVWLNFYEAWFGDKTIDRRSALIALLTRMAPGRISVIVAGGGFLAFLTMLLMQKNNELVAAQNYYFQQQIYQQRMTDQGVQLAALTEKLYHSKEQSAEEIADEVQPEPYYEKQIRTTSAIQFIALSREPPIQPSRSGS